MSARQIRRDDIVRSKITGRTGPVLRVEQYDDGTPRITAELTKGYDTGVPGHHFELVKSADEGRVHDVAAAERQAYADLTPRPFQVGDRVRPRPGTSDGTEGPGIVSGTAQPAWTPGDYMVHVRHDSGTITSWDSSDLELIETAPSGIDEYSCPEDGCDCLIGAVGPLADDEPDHFAEEIEAHRASHELQAGDRYMYDGMLVEVTVVDGDKVEFRAVHDQDAINLGWFPTSYDTYEASMTLAAFREMVDGASAPEGDPADIGEGSRCPACIDNPGWAHGDTSRRAQPRDVCRECLGSGTRQVGAGIPVPPRPADAAGRALAALLEWEKAADDIGVSIALMVSRTTALRAAARDYRDSLDVHTTPLPDLPQRVRGATLAPSYIDEVGGAS